MDLLQTHPREDHSLLTVTDNWQKLIKENSYVDLDEQGATDFLFQFRLAHLAANK